MSIKKSRGVKALAVAVLTGLLSLTGVGAAHSQGLPGAAQLDLANIKDSQTGKIIIHKYQNPVWTGKKGDGKAVDQIPDSAIALENVEFSIRQVKDVDLTKSEGWDQAKALYNKVNQITENQLDQAKKKRTNNLGVAEFESLPLGLYLVEETDYSQAKSKGKPVKVTKGVEKFLVAVPYPSDEWLYEVNVYPKNSVHEDGKKTAQYDAHFTEGKTLPWKIELPIPALADGAKSYSKFGMYDVLENYLTFESVTDVKVDQVPLQVGKDYEVLTNLEKDNKKAIHFRLLQSGLEKLLNKNMVTLTINTKVTKIPQNKIVENNFYPETPTYDPYTDSEGEPGKPTPGDKVYYGNITGKKIDQANSKPLSGAEFAVYATPDANGEPIAKATSNEQGVFTFKNLRIDSDNAPLADGATYYFKETKAPAGYILDPSVKTVKLTRQNNTVDYSYGDFNNSKVPGPNLPLTGAQGKILLTIAGIAVLAFAGGVQIVSARRKRA
ncbi:SpaH/EbpB family LPXTG-anchored major pilin [Arcanobacterium hippocoleae]|uniref:Fimbrial isopeptide formation D2 family protein/LPXTG-motif cell wall-anchored protein n=1 Tax=Arcanobacterium hippocoleae TaxID=149017 RepID=A0ABU1T2S5_9ACTO|nr:SpaH/EbpB family LPXTG-anchored major pilin [Arcanobacterium hippocoleae]MDR6939648.1 fimbrial isopeptide formation D2 family protein/LPXTG-motif cell wall-anchored protein [Arcanobacterium hippocoleae]